MTLKLRLVLASLIGACWYGFVSPEIMSRIQKQRSRGLTLDAVENVQDLVAEKAGELEPEVLEMVDMLNNLKAQEDERIYAMMSLPEQEAIGEAAFGIKDLPPPRYESDHRFFEPLIPELTVLIIETYGYAVQPLAETDGPPSEGRRSDKLEILLSLVHHKLLSDEHAAQILSASMELSAIEVKRRTIETALRDIISEDDSGL